MLHLGEVFTEDNVSTLLCFICGCKHIPHNGYIRFGKPIRKGNIDFRSDQNQLLEYLFAAGADHSIWNENLSYKHYRDHFGEAVASDPHLQAGVFEWKRKVLRNGVWEEAICCPEDVARTPLCTHDEDSVCSKCNIPICNDCWGACMRHETIPKALACDNYMGYVHQFIIDHRVAWLEATIASPFFSGLVTYYIDGPPASRRNLMDTPLAQADLSYGVRGNLFSFLLAWEHVLQQLHSKVEDGDLSQWPLIPEQVCQVVRVRSVHSLRR